MGVAAIGPTSLDPQRSSRFSSAFDANPSNGSFGVSTSVGVLNPSGGIGSIRFSVPKG
jgi:hypothetical protein